MFNEFPAVKHDDFLVLSPIPGFGTSAPVFSMNATVDSSAGSSLCKARFPAMASLAQKGKITATRSNPGRDLGLFDNWHSVCWRPDTGLQIAYSGSRYSILHLGRGFTSFLDLHKKGSKLNCHGSTASSGFTEAAFNESTVGDLRRWLPVCSWTISHSPKDANIIEKQFKPQNNHHVKKKIKRKL